MICLAMRPWMADLVGLVLGFALGGAALVHFLPQIEQLRLPAFVSASGPRAQPVRVASAAPLPAVVEPTRLAPVMPASLPRVQLPDVAPQAAALPRVVEPDDPSPPPLMPGPHTAVAGTGFFVADGLVMTAAHVVPKCGHVAIISPFVPRSKAEIEARDTSHDIALLQVPGVRAPATLAIGRPTTAGARVFMLGYPPGSQLREPESTWGVLENDKLPPQGMTSPGQHVVFEASAVTHGYSGGAVFDPQSGKVVGIVRAMLDPAGFSRVPGMPSSGLVVGPGSALLSNFLQDEAPGTDAFPADQWGDDPVSVLRRATVHVFCMQ